MTLKECASPSVIEFRVGCDLARPQATAVEKAWHPSRSKANWHLHFRSAQTLQGRSPPRPEGRRNSKACRLCQGHAPPSVFDLKPSARATLPGSRRSSVHASFHRRERALGATLESVGCSWFLLLYTPIETHRPHRPLRAAPGADGRLGRLLGRVGRALQRPRVGARTRAAPTARGRTPLRCGAAACRAVRGSRGEPLRNALFGGASHASEGRKALVQYCYWQIYNQNGLRWNATSAASVSPCAAERLDVIGR